MGTGMGCHRSHLGVRPMMKRLAKYNAVAGTVLVAASLLTAILVGWTGFATVIAVAVVIGAAAIPFINR